VERNKPGRKRISQLCGFWKESRQTLKSEISVHAVPETNDPSLLSLFIVFHNSHKNIVNGSQLKLKKVSSFKNREQTTESS
jgi:hypothetical protein